MLFSDLPIDHRVKKALDAKQLSELTAIQQKVIAPALKGSDVVASSKTGSGKTLAFLVPCVHRLLTSRALTKKDPRVLILAPTRELAKQVFGEARWLTANMSIQCQLIVGGENYNDQIKALRRNPHIIVGTAGRIADHLENKSFFINGLELLILDEADRMLDLGFSDQLNLINRYADHRKRQTMMFSATIGKVAVDALADTLLSSPVRVAVGSDNEQHRDIQQHMMYVDHVEQKDALLPALLKDQPHNQAIIFVATRSDTERLASALNKQGFDAIALHAELAQNQRSNVMNAFMRGQHSQLICTDVASRGLDLPHVELVVNFDLPKQSEEYIHRIGRTGRAGKTGKAISLVGPRDWASFVNIRALLDYTLDTMVVPGFTAKFAGHDDRKSIAKAVPASNAGAKKSAKTDPEKPKKRVKSMQGVEVGDAPIKRKPRAPVVDDDPDTED
ncbi:DEAD/DEAH box helicase [Alteromonas oceanisediminis]|uniref:DEAD/DEAH box helicase n=1 Tax=Alteromonas oceanisediminis TaxID=2836180 RepID=UPI001BD9E6B0|nr:DEAD/DEAH box helicase [Alteromonas oceanisediminis]MBT0587172.1 DEAD/DEAH box helicase [Alteromonas oceanisediminis]